MSDQGKSRMPRLHHHLVITGGVIMTLLAGCRSTLHQTFAFEPVEQRLEGGGTISLVARGESTSTDSAGILIERTESPYWVGVYVRHASMSALRVKEVQFVSAESRTAMIPTVPATEVLSDGETRFVQFKALELSFEDHEVLVSLEDSVGGGTRTDSVRLYLRKHRAERRVSFWEWLTHL